MSEATAEATEDLDSLIRDVRSAIHEKNHIRLLRDLAHDPRINWHEPMLWEYVGGHLDTEPILCRDVAVFLKNTCKVDAANPTKPELYIAGDWSLYPKDKQRKIAIVFLLALLGTPYFYPMAHRSDYVQELLAGPNREKAIIWIGSTSVEREIMPGIHSRSTRFIWICHLLLVDEAPIARALKEIEQFSPDLPFGHRSRDPWLHFFCYLFQLVQDSPELRSATSSYMGEHHPALPVMSGKATSIIYRPDRAGFGGG